MILINKDFGYYPIDCSVPGNMVVVLQSFGLSSLSNKCHDNAVKRFINSPM